MIFVMLCVALVAAGQDGGVSRGFRFPDIPSEMKTPGERATYLSLHFWEHFDFREWDVDEQVFVDFLSVLSISERPEEALEEFVERAASGRSAGERERLAHYVELLKKYLYEPMSPMRDDDMYVIALQAVAGERRVPAAERARARWLLERMMMNGVGDVAADFEYVREDGTVARLSDVAAEYVLVFFNDPGCRDCRVLRGRLDASAVLDAAVAGGRLEIVDVCLDDESEFSYYGEKYDLRALPVLYLLDSRKRVVLKNPSVDALEGKIEPEATVSR